MRKIVTLVFTLITAVAYSQSPTSKRLNSGVDLGAAFKNDYLVPSITYYEMLNVDRSQLFSIGWTIKLNTFYGDNLNYTTAPAHLTRGKSGFAALSAPIKPANIDTMRFDYVTATAVNLGLRAQIRLGPVEVGASADVLGFGFGKGRQGRYRSSTGRYEVRNTTGTADSVITFRSNPLQSAQPQRVNVRLLGDNDLGSLSTEVYVRLRLMRRLGIKAGYQWITTAMRANNVNIEDDNQRFRNRASMAYVAVTLPFFK
ncbi:hypothetical protein [Larkinella rosea]|uniref:Outer membrane protein beta-barrel domain-containing protein n=1 Tax=Larkinella rosea TaxID=2025312 RepID=A0A3P1BIU1_9BACT|nr:hypothetical protein [Larkinella rosea]RRB00816.1 hypothetical protein EHT25_21725 [Larkinella rosea]